MQVIFKNQLIKQLSVESIFPKGFVFPFPKSINKKGSKFFAFQRLETSPHTQWFTAAHTFPNNRHWLSPFLRLARWYCCVNMSLFFIALVPSSNKSISVCSVAINLCLHPKVLTLAGMRCCFSVVFPLLVVTDSGKAPGRICCSP